MAEDLRRVVQGARSVKQCPKCGLGTKVTGSKSRRAKGSHYERLVRRRECCYCEHRYNTIEMMESEYNELKTIQNVIKRVNKEEK
jgi:transcriptional regulator NrdR family protein